MQRFLLAARCIAAKSGYYVSQLCCFANKGDDDHNLDYNLCPHAQKASYDFMILRDDCTLAICIIPKTLLSMHSRRTFDVVPVSRMSIAILHDLGKPVTLQCLQTRTASCCCTWAFALDGSMRAAYMFLHGHSAS